MQDKSVNTSTFITLLISIFSYSCHGILERNEQPLDSAYIAVQEINENYRSDIFEVKLFCETQVSSSSSPNPIRIFQSVNNQLIVSCDIEKNVETQGDIVYYKIKNNGTVEDSLQLNLNQYGPDFIDDFIIFTTDDQSYYTTWPQNGDTSRHTIQILNQDLNWNEEKVNKKIEQVKKNVPYWFLKNVTKNDQYYMQFFYYENKQWYLLWQKVSEYKSPDDQETANRFRKDVFWTGEIDPYLPENVNFVHFHPEEKLKYSHNIGGGSPGFSVTNWRGKAFFQTKIGENDFNFFSPHIAVEKEKFDNYKNRFYTIVESSYPAITFRPSFYISPNGFAFYSSNSQSMYIIHQKTSQ